ncbi:MAG: alpha-ketoglutarate decarboxylase [Kordia sp.]|nr:MAG: alpha-ketoglutarate decarboxylase [Kordia sp.]
MTITQDYFSFLLFTLFFSIITNAQETENIDTPKEKSEFWSKVRFGGGIGLNFSNGYTNIAISPSGVYQFNEQFAGGVGLNGNYSSRKNYFNATVLGGSLITLFKPIREIQLSAEFEQNNVNYKDKVFNSNTNYWTPALFLGAGYSIGDFGAIGMRYDVLYNDRKSVYGTAFIPFIRVFF